MRKSIIHTSILAAAMGCASLAFAATPQQASQTGSSPATSAQTAQRSLMDELGLNDQQRSSIQQAIQQAMQKANPQVQALQQKQAAFESATPGSPGYQSAANTLAQAASTATHDEVLRQADLRAKIYKILTPTQRTKLAQLRAQQRQKTQQEMQQRRQQQRSSQQGTSGSPTH